MTVALGLIVKNEVHDIAEWVAHHSLLGFDRIFAYDNCSDDGTTQLLDSLSGSFPLTHRLWPDDEKPVPGLTKQGAAYQDCIERSRTEHDWMMFLDADEFLIAPPEETLADFLDRHDEHDGVALNWRIFGSNALHSIPNRLVTEAFIRRAPSNFPANRHVKMFFRPYKATRVVNPHFVETGSPVFDIDGREMSWSTPGVTHSDRIVQGAWKLHHYIIRSKEHWERRVARRQPDGHARDWSTFSNYDRNEIIDLSAIESARVVHRELTQLGLSYAPVPELELPGHLARTIFLLPAPSQPVAAESSPLACFLDMVADGCVRGWAHDPAGGATPVTLHACIDGTPVETPVLCDLARSDVLKSPVAKDRVGFAFDLDEVWLDGEPHVLSLRDGDGRPVFMAIGGVHQAEFTFIHTDAVKVFSFVDEMQQSVLRGWVACRRGVRRPVESSCTVLVSCNGEDVITVVADRPRPDVAAEIGCPAKCGFMVPLPPAYRRATVQEFRFFLMPERIELSRSPLVTSFAQQDYAMKLTSVLDEIESIAGRIDEARSTVRSILPKADFDIETYDLWARQYLRVLSKRVADERDARPAMVEPLVSIVCPVYRPVPSDFHAAVSSIQAQTYQNWELILVEDGSDQPQLSRMIAEFVASDRRIVLMDDGINRGISGATNIGLETARGRWVAFFDHDDLLVDVALECMIRALTDADACLAYSDEDKIDEFGLLSEPMFKPDWNYRYLLGINYVNHLTIVRRDVLREVGYLDATYNGAQDHDLLLRLSEVLGADEIVHVPEVLYHWRKAAQSTASSGSVKEYAVSAGRRCVADHIARTGREAEVESIRSLTMYRVHWRFSHGFRVTIIIPFKDKMEMTRRCVDHIGRHTRTGCYDIILVDNNSDEPATLDYLRSLDELPDIRVMRIEEEFNYSRLNNLAAATSDADFFLFMNNDLFVLDDNWLDTMLDEAVADDRVGAVGGKFLYENRTIQHCGVVLGIGGVAGHVMCGEAEQYAGYGNRAVLAHEVSAVTAACVLVRADVFDEVGGFDEVGLKIAFNDIDLCLKIRAAGYRIILATDFVAEHHESVSRGAEDRPEKVERFNRETATMVRRWGDTLVTDPFYNRHFRLDRKPFHDLVALA